MCFYAIQFENSSLPIMWPEASTTVFPSMYLPKTPGSASRIAITVEESVSLTPRKIAFIPAFSSAFCSSRGATMRWREREKRIGGSQLVLKLVLFLWSAFFVLFLSRLFFLLHNSGYYTSAWLVGWEISIRDLKCPLRRTCERSEPTTPWDLTYKQLTQPTKRIV